MYFRVSQTQTQGLNLNLASPLSQRQDLWNLLIDILADFFFNHVDMYFLGFTVES